MRMKVHPIWLYFMGYTLLVPGMPIQSNRWQSSIIDCHIFYRLDYYRSVFIDFFGLIIRVLRLIFVCIFDIPLWKLQFVTSIEEYKKQT